jgi:hypothetical protein
MVRTAHTGCQRWRAAAFGRICLVAFAPASRRTSGYAGIGGVFVRLASAADGRGSAPAPFGLAGVAGAAGLGSKTDCLGRAGRRAAGFGHHGLDALGFSVRQPAPSCLTLLRCDGVFRYRFRPNWLELDELCDVGTRHGSWNAGLKRLGGVLTTRVAGPRREPHVASGCSGLVRGTDDLNRPDHRPVVSLPLTGPVTTAIMRSDY